MQNTNNAAVGHWQPIERFDATATRKFLLYGKETSQCIVWQYPSFVDTDGFSHYAEIFTPNADAPECPKDASLHDVAQLQAPTIEAKTFEFSMTNNELIGAIGNTFEMIRNVGDIVCSQTFRDELRSKLINQLQSLLEIQKKRATFTTLNQTPIKETTT